MHYARGTFWRHWEEKKDSAKQSNGEYLKEYYSNVWIYAWQPIFTASRYQKGITSSAKNKPRRVKDQHNVYCPK